MSIKRALRPAERARLRNAVIVAFGGEAAVNRALREYIETADLLPLVRKHRVDPHQWIRDVLEQTAAAELRSTIQANRKRRAAARKPRQARLPPRTELHTELEALRGRMSRADAVKALARRYKVEPPAVNARLRRKPK